MCIKCIATNVTMLRSSWRKFKQNDISAEGVQNKNSKAYIQMRGQKKL